MLLLKLNLKILVCHAKFIKWVDASLTSKFDFRLHILTLGFKFDFRALFGLRGGIYAIVLLFIGHYGFQVYFDGSI